MNRGRGPLPLALLAGLSALGPTGCGGGDRPYAFDDAACERLARADGAAPDAPDWLRSPGPRPKGLGDHTTTESIALTHQFLAAGATRLAATEVGERTAAGRTTLAARGLVVGLPVDPKRRHAVFALYAAQARDAGYAPHRDDGLGAVRRFCRQGHRVWRDTRTWRPHVALGACQGGERGRRGDPPGLQPRAHGCAWRNGASLRGGCKLLWLPLLRLATSKA